MNGLAPPTADRPAGQAAPAVAVDVRDEFDVAGVIAAATRLCQQHGLGGVFAAHVATAASELANNLWMHALQGGQVRLAVIAQGAQRGVELQAEDDGPGIADIDLALTEGYSTGGGMGCGLPGVRRLMDEFQIDSRTAAGTCGTGGTLVVARKWLHRQA